MTKVLQNLHRLRHFQARTICCICTERGRNITIEYPRLMGRTLSQPRSTMGVTLDEYLIYAKAQSAACLELQKTKNLADFLYQQQFDGVAPVRATSPREREQRENGGLADNIFHDDPVACERAPFAGLLHNALRENQTPSVNTGGPRRASRSICRFPDYIKRKKDVHIPPMSGTPAERNSSQVPRDARTT